jgi:hypothetical protein
MFSRAFTSMPGMSCAFTLAQETGPQGHSPAGTLVGLLLARYRSDLPFPRSCSIKRLTLPCLIVACQLATTGTSQEGNKDEIELAKLAMKFDMAHLEKVYGIKLKDAKFKAAKVIAGKTDSDMLITMTLEFTRDVPESPRVAGRGKDLTSLRNLFAGKPRNFDPRPNVKRQPRPDVLLQCYLFDVEGVAFTKQPPGKIEGEVSGKEGDSFRIMQSVASAVFAKTRKVSFREEPAPKPK